MGDLYKRRLDEASAGEPLHCSKYISGSMYGCHRERGHEGPCAPPNHHEIGRGQLATRTEVPAERQCREEVVKNGRFGCGKERGHEGEHIFFADGSL